MNFLVKICMIFLLLFSVKYLVVQEDVKILTNYFYSKNISENAYKSLNFDAIKINKKAKEALKFCQNNAYNQEFCILIDMSIHSGLKRFFIWDFKKDTIISACLVSHGCGDKDWYSDKTKENPIFSNQDGSHCTSLGKYKIGKRGYSNWGINVNYIMHGLENTNSNALKRQIVFHSWEAISDAEVYPAGTPEGWGCPAISNKSMITIDSLIKNQSKAVLMWIFI